MSLDFCQVFFSSVDPSLTPSKIKNKLTKTLQKKGFDSLQITCLKNKNDKRDKCIELEIDAIDMLDQGILEEIFAFLENLPKNFKAYAEISYEELQDEEKTYHCFINDEIKNFPDFKSIDDYLTENPFKSPEYLFISEFGDRKNLMLIKLTISAVKFKEQFISLCNHYIASKSDEDFEMLKSLLNKNASKQFPIDFPNLLLKEEWKKKGFTGECDIKIAKSLCFCKAEKDQVFLGFMSPKLSSSRKKVINGESNAMNLVTAFKLCKSIKQVRAKMWADYENAKKEWCVYAIDEIFYTFPDKQNPLTLWNNPYN